jgi:hypothetical protein
MNFVLKRGAREFRIWRDSEAANDRYLGSIDGVVVTTNSAPEGALDFMIRSTSGRSLIREQVCVDAFGEVRHWGRADRE